MATSRGVPGLQRRDRGLGVCNQTGHVDDHPRVVFLDPPRLDQPLTRGTRELGQRRADLGAHLGRRCDRDEVGLGEVAVVVRFFLRAARDRAAACFVPVPGLLHDRVAELARSDLPARFVLDRLHERSQRVQVLDLAARPELSVTHGPDRHVRVDAERAFLHLHVGDTDREQRGAQLLDVALGLLGRTDVGLGDDLEQRHAGAVVVDEGVLGVVDAPTPADVQRLAGVLFEVRARDADALAVHLELPVDRDREVVLRRLVVLRHVRIEVVLAREHRAFGHVEIAAPRRHATRTRPPSRSTRAANRAGRGTPGTRSCSARCRTRSGTRRTACSRSRARSALRARPRSPRSSFRSQTSRGQTTDRDESLSSRSRRAMPPTTPRSATA